MRRPGLKGLLFLLVTSSPGLLGAQVDMTGTWKVVVNPDLLMAGPEIWEFTQSGSSLDVDSPLATATGTIDPLTGEFLFVLGPGAPPFCTGMNDSLPGTAALDGLNFDARLIALANSPTHCGAFVIELRGGRCLNAPLDPGEECITPYETVTGTKLVVRDVVGNPDRRKVVFIARGTGFGPALPDTAGDPRGGATLILARGAAEVASINLPAAGWSGLTPGPGYRFRNPSGTLGPCRSAIWRNDVLKVVCRGSGIGFSLDEPSQGTLSVTFQPGFGVRACAEFGGVLRDTQAIPGRPGMFKAVSAPAPIACTPESVP